MLAVIACHFAGGRVDIQKLAFSIAVKEGIQRGLNDASVFLLLQLAIRYILAGPEQFDRIARCIFDDADIQQNLTNIAVPAQDLCMEMTFVICIRTG